MPGTRWAQCRRHNIATRACVRRAVSRQEARTGLPDTTHGPQTRQAGSNARCREGRPRAACTHSLLRAVDGPPDPGRGDDVADEQRTQGEREKYVAPKTFCATTTNFLLWLISRRGNSAGLEPFRRRSGPVCAHYRPKSRRRQMAGPTWSQERRRMALCLLERERTSKESVSIFVIS